MELTSIKLDNSRAESSFELKNKIKTGAEFSYMM